MGGASGNAGTAGTTGGPCAPVGKFYTGQQLADADSAKCGVGADISSRIPNPAEASISDFPLPAPMVAGVPYAVSMTTMATATPGSIELWGSSEECAVDELLWWGNIESKTLCAEFTPTRAHSRAVIVIRQLGPLKSVFFGAPNDVTLCPMGSCPSGMDGSGLSPGKALPPPPAGLYSLRETSFYRGYDYDVGSGVGRIVALIQKDGPNTSPRPLVGGVVRMLPYDQFGDAWYCIGQGSTFGMRDDGATVVSLRGLTRLPSCSSGTGTAMAAFSGAQATVTSSLSDLAVSGVSARQHCLGTGCSFEFVDVSAGKQTFLNVTTASTIATSGGTSDVTLGTWLEAFDTSDAMRMSCVGSGNVAYAPSGSTQLSLGGMSGFVSCPGAQITNDSTDIVIE